MTTDELIREIFPHVLAVQQSTDGTAVYEAERIEDALRQANNDLCSEIYNNLIS